MRSTRSKEEEGEKLRILMCGDGEGWREEIGGEGGAGFDVGVFTVVEEGEWAGYGDEDGGVGRGCLAFESGGSAKS